MNINKLVVHKKSFAAGASAGTTTTEQPVELKALEFPAPIAAEGYLGEQLRPPMDLRQLGTGTLRPTTSNAQAEVISELLLAGWVLTARFVQTFLYTRTRSCFTLHSSCAGLQWIRSSGLRTC